MTRIAYVQKQNGEFINVNAFSSWYGFTERGWDVRPFEMNDLLAGNLELTRATVVHGGVKTVCLALQQVGAPPPDYARMLEPLLGSYQGRKIWFATLGEVRSRSVPWPVFIKPSKVDKLFTGCVISEFRDLLETSELGDDTEVLCQDVVKWMSEYRAFIHRAEVVSLKHYKGDWRMMPSVNVIDDSLRAWKGPVAYSLDFGVTEEGFTWLIEANDAFALGAYGLPPMIYSLMIESRWDEMVEN